MHPLSSTQHPAAWAHFAITVFCLAATVCFALVATRRLWAGARANLVVGSGAKLAFVIGTFVALVVVTLSACDLVLGVEVEAPLVRAIGAATAYLGALLGFDGALRLDPVIQALLAGRPSGLRKVAPVEGGPCWVCGEAKTSPKHLAGCPAGKGGAS